MNTEGKQHPSDDASEAAEIVDALNPAPIMMGKPQFDTVLPPGKISNVRLVNPSEKPDKPDGL